MTMNGKLLRYYAFCLLFLLAPILAEAASTTSKDVDITVTHVGTPPPGVLTTATYKNLSGSTLPAGTPVSFGQGFRYGDIMPGTRPVIRDAATHAPLVGQQWDEISTWRENGGNGSWRHAVWAAWLPNSVPPGGTFQFEFVASVGSYSESSHQSLSVLCSGPAAHDLKLHLTDVRNQDDTVRDSGDATFRVCDNIANVGRDVPRHVRAGNVYDEYIVSGIPVYTSGRKDPLLYHQAIIDIFTKASDGVSAGDVRWVILNHNSWENVAAGNTGNPGNPGPAGFANDPQAVSYHAQIDDGASVSLDWSGLDAVISSASNPVEPGYPSGPHCHSYTGAEPYCLYVPSSVGLNKWYTGQATRTTCSGTCVAGLTNGGLYFVWSAGTATTGDLVASSPYVSFLKNPYVDLGAWAGTNSQGSGTTTFSARVMHYHAEAWQTLDGSGQANWSPFGTTSRVTRKVYPVFTTAERRYWEQTGLIIPMYLDQPTPTLQTIFGYGDGDTYGPFGKGTLTGGPGGGAHPDLGISNEFAAQAWITQTETHWDYMRLFSLEASMHGPSTMLDEATGRIPPLNNGSPTGPGGSGSGAPYAGLGAFHNQATWGPQGLGDSANWFGRTGPQAGAPDIGGGTYRGATGLDHMPSFGGFTYPVFGDRNLLDLLYTHANTAFLQQQVGPGEVLGMGYYRDNNAIGPDGNQHHYFGSLLACCQTRGSAWLIRDVLYGAAFGGDNNIERSLFNDMVTESANYYPLFLKFKDGPTSTNYRTSIQPPNDINDAGPDLTIFLVDYLANVGYILETFVHSPMGSMWNSKMQRFIEGTVGAQLAGMGNGPGLIPTWYVGAYDTNPTIHDGDAGYKNSHTCSGCRDNVGPYTNGSDATDFSLMLYGMAVLTGGQLQLSHDAGCSTCPGNAQVTAGDTVKGVNPYYWGTGLDNLDQLKPATEWYEIMAPIDTTTNKFYLRCPIGHAVTADCPTPGKAFTKFTRGGTLIENQFTNEVVKWRPQYDPGPGVGYNDTNYNISVGQIVNTLDILGYNVKHAKADVAARGITYNPTLPSFWWDTTIVVPGLPAAVNGL